MDIDGHGTFLKKCIENKIVNKEVYNTYTLNIGKNTVSEVSKPTTTVLNDPRFNSPEFKADVRLVLEYLGLESNMRNFKKYDKKHGSETPVNWIEFAENIRHPKQRAIVKIIGSEAETFVELIGKTREVAIKTLDMKEYSFKRWV